MRKLPLLLLLALPFAGGCQSDQDKSTNPYVQWERKQDADADHDFFYKGWLNPAENDEQQLDHPPIGITGPPPN